MFESILLVVAVSYCLWMFGVVLFSCWRAAQSRLQVRAHWAAVIPRLSLGWLSQRWASPVEDPCMRVPSEEVWKVALGQVRMAKQSVNYIRKAERTDCDWCLSKASQDWKTSPEERPLRCAYTSRMQAGHPEGWVWGLLVQAYCNKVQRHIVMPSNQIEGSMQL